MSVSISAPFEFTLKRQPAKMAVVRSDGFCWGRMLVGGEEFDVFTRKDWYDYSDVDAALAFIRAAKRGKYEEPAASWRLA